MNTVSINLPTQQIIQKLLPELKSYIKEELENHAKQDGYYTAQEVQEILRISESTLWRRAKEGSIISTRIGRLVRFPKSQFQNN